MQPELTEAATEHLAMARALLRNGNSDARRKEAEALAHSDKLPGVLLRELPAMAKGQDKYVKLCIAAAIVKSGRTDPWLSDVLRIAGKKHYELGSSDEHNAHYDLLMMAVKSLGEIGPVKKEVVVGVLAANLIGGDYEFEQRVQTRKVRQEADEGFPQGDQGLPWIRVEAGISLGRRGQARQQTLCSSHAFGWT